MGERCRRRGGEKNVLVLLLSLQVLDYLATKLTGSLGFFYSSLHHAPCISSRFLCVSASRPIYTGLLNVGPSLTCNPTQRWGGERRGAIARIGFGYYIETDE